MQVLKVALLAVSILTISSAKAEAVMVKSYGCGQWIEARERKVGNALFVEIWLDGYLSGLAVGSHIKFWEKGGSSLDRKSAYLWIDNYCRANPLKNTADAGSALFREHTK